jgi:uncharacterized protein (TIGR03435 family)
MLGLLASAVALAQAPPPAFETASVKPSAPDDMRGATYHFQPGGVEVTNGTLRAIVQMAYDVQAFQICGAAGWMDSERYDVAAKLASADRPAPAADPQSRIRQMRLRLQALLADRFQLQVHRETREIPEYALVPAKNGPKLVESAPAAAPGPSGIRAACGQLSGIRATTANLAYALSRQLRRPVVDRSGLAGAYDFQIEFAPDAGGCSAPAGTEEPTPPSDAAASIFTALQERLGLKLEAIKGPMEVIVIDRAARPDPN